jgi:hypothetical protein
MSVVGLARTPRRCDLVMDAIRECVEKRRNILNSEPGIRSVTVTVKMRNGTGGPRVAILSVETEDELSE